MNSQNHFVHCQLKARSTAAGQPDTILGDQRPVSC